MRTYAWAIGVLLASQSVAGAQRDPPDAVERMRSRAAERAADAERESNAEREAADRARAVQGDTLRFGSFVVITPAASSPVVRAGVSLAGTRMQRLIGTDVEPWVSDTLKLVFSGTSQRERSAEVMGMLEDSDANDVAQAIVTRLRSAMARDASVGLRRWAGFPLGKDSSSLFREANVELLTAAPGATTKCIVGDLRQCAISLGLVIPPDPAHAFWDSAGRYETVRREGPRWNVPDHRQNIAECLRLRDDAACTAFIQQILAYDPARWTLDLAPVGRAGREALLLTAVRMGGGEGVRALHLDAGDSIITLVEAAARQPIDSVVSVWRASVLAARPDERLQRSSRLAAVLWSLGFALVAIGGSLWRG
jgi:hypothetical protein